MSTMRSELSTKNKYYIDRYRYYELKYFCLQYPTWKSAYHALDGLHGRINNSQGYSKNKPYTDPTAKCVEARSCFYDKMDAVEQAATNTDPVLGVYILKAVTEGLSYTCLKTKMGIPCCKNTYYDLYRRFFWLLNERLL